MSAIDGDRLVHLVRERGFGDDVPQAERAIVSTLHGLAAHIPDLERDALARDLPPVLARAVSHASYRGPGSIGDLYVAIPREHVQIVLGALGEVLPDELRARLERVLGPSIAELLRGVARSEGEPPPYAEAHGATEHSLATGKTGSAHPISESRPPGAQTDSVAARNPHADTKLSSARRS